MEIDTVKVLLRTVLELMKEIDLEMCAHIVILEKRAKPLKKTDPPLREQVKVLMDDPESKSVIDQKYVRIFESVEKSIDDRELLEILANWKPAGRIN